MHTVGLEEMNDGRSARPAGGGSMVAAGAWERRSGGGWMAMASGADESVAVDVLGARQESGDDGPPTVHLALYAHGYGVDVSAHPSHAAAMAAAGGVALDQCARDPDIREAVTRRFGRWNAAEMDDRRLAELLDAWSELAPGESLWVTECVLEAEEEVIRARSKLAEEPS